MTFGNVRPDPEHYTDWLERVLLGGIVITVVVILVVGYLFDKSSAYNAGSICLGLTVVASIIPVRKKVVATRLRKQLWWEEMSGLLSIGRNIARAMNGKIFVVGVPPESSVGEALHMHVRIETETQDRMWRLPDHKVAEQFNLVAKGDRIVCFFREVPDHQFKGRDPEKFRLTDRFLSFLEFKRCPNA